MSKKTNGLSLSLSGFLVAAVLLVGVAVTRGQSVLGEEWARQGNSLEAGESFQFRVGYDEIPVRRWNLTVDGGALSCDVSVLRVLGEELIYYKTRESLHEVSIPWGLDEEIMVVVTNRDLGGSFQVCFLGPPREEIQASYSYEVNRALENFAAGKNIMAEEACRKALKRDSNDWVAKVLLAGFLRNQQFYEQAAVLVDEALAGGVSGNILELAESLQSELIILRAPLPESVLDGVELAHKFLDDGNGQEALDVCEKILDGKLELDGPSRGKFLTLKGRAMELLGRNFAAVDAYTGALSFTRSKAGKAVVYFHMGQLFQQMDNLAQARGSFTIALEYGLPSGLELQAREALKGIGEELKADR
ncbi:MAG: hypothetical protein KOO60_12175 [Gemmatimonadales bacterium]|nr:hypothetical protein [Gemmatimonadales bacterium]